jgi:hypothetical protein
MVLKWDDFRKKTVNTDIPDVRQYIDDIFVEFGEQPSIHLILINIDTRIFFIFHYYRHHIFSEDKNKDDYAVL